MDQMHVQLLQTVRAKSDQIESIPYSQLGIAAAANETSGPAYFETDPVYHPEYSATDDHLLSDTTTAPNGMTVTREVTVMAVDDPTDGTGSSDADQVSDANTTLVLDYKLVTITATATVNGVQLKQQLTTIVRGDVPAEINGATGENYTGGEIPAPPGRSKTGYGPPDPPPVKYDSAPTNSSDNPQPEKGKTPGLPSKTGSSAG
jgi:hypothetical protein